MTDGKKFSIPCKIYFGQISLKRHKNESLTSKKRHGLDQEGHDGPGSFP